MTLRRFLPGSEDLREEWSRSGFISRISPDRHSQTTSLFCACLVTSFVGILPSKWLLGMTLRAPFVAGVSSRWRRMVTMLSSSFLGGWTCGSLSFSDHLPYPSICFCLVTVMVRSWCHVTAQFSF